MSDIWSTALNHLAGASRHLPNGQNQGQPHLQSRAAKEIQAAHTCSNSKWSDNLPTLLISPSYGVWAHGRELHLIRPRAGGNSPEGSSRSSPLHENAPRHLQGLVFQSGWPEAMENQRMMSTLQSSSAKLHNLLPQHQWSRPRIHVHCADRALLGRCISSQSVPLSKSQHPRQHVAAWTNWTWNLGAGRLCRTCFRDMPSAYPHPLLSTYLLSGFLASLECEAACL